jgi:hypothetical protein
MRGKESSLDIRASKDICGRRLSLLVECKKCNPEFVDWLFFKKPSERCNGTYIASSVENVQRPSPNEGWDTSGLLHPLETSVSIADEGRETRGDYQSLKNSSSKTKTSNNAIQDAAHQVSLAKQAVSYEDTECYRRMGQRYPSVSMPFRQKLYFPTIVTTANIHICEFDPTNVNPQSGEIEFGHAKITKCDVLVFEYPLPRHLQVLPVNLVDSFNEGIVDSFTKAHLFVVQSAYFSTFLSAFHDNVVLPPL